MLANNAMSFLLVCLIDALLCNFVFRLEILGVVLLVLLRGLIALKESGRFSFFDLTCLFGEPKYQEGSWSLVFS